MSLPVLLFASYAEAFGARELALSMPLPCRTSDVLAALRALPGGDRLPPAPLVAVNQRWIRGDVEIQAGDEVAVIPPVAGG